jgi:anaerobic magnesium-protoporphyrin IX monomethyl ester cyclase
MKYDIVIPSIARVSQQTPLIAPSILKVCLEREGYRCKVIDWNRNLYDRLQKKMGLLMFNLDSLTFINNEVFNYIWNKYLKSETDALVSEIQKYEPEWVGIPYFSSYTVLLGDKLCEEIRRKAPHIKILAGGDVMKYHGQSLLKTGKADRYILGEAENAIVQLFEGNFDYYGIDGNQPDVVDINTIPIPDYSDLDIRKYSYISVIGSRGCVNKCKFCDVNYYSKKFRQRKAELIAEEMLAAVDLGQRRIIFADNLINGSLKEFRKLSHLINRKGIKWSGQMICRSDMEYDDYKIASKAGFIGGYIGVESGSERVRFEMGKKYSNKTLFKTLELMTKCNISAQIFLIVGWPTETENEFKETLDLLTEISKRKYLIQHINIGGTFKIADTQHGNGVFEYTFDKFKQWIYEGNTMQVRLDRWFKLYDHLEKIGLTADAKHFHRLRRLRYLYDQ